MTDLSAFDSADEPSTDMAATYLTDSGNVRTMETKVEQKREVYQNEDISDSADEVDPRRLFRTPLTYDEIRWYATYCGEAKTIIKKPIKDAFKNGFDVVDDPTNSVQGFLEDYEPHYKTAEIKARRDGLSAILFQLTDAASISEEPRDVASFDGFQILTLDDFADNVPQSAFENDSIDFDRDQVKVTDEGLVVVNDLTTHRHGDLLGYAVEKRNGRGNQFIHESRCQHFAWNTEDDGKVAEDTFGEWQGNSVLLPIMIPLKSLVKTKWALGQTMFRYSSPLYVIETPENYSDDQHEKVQEQLGGLNTASDVALPAGCVMQTEGTDGEIDPEPFVAALREDICSGSMMTKSVLQGTQTGTVSGSSTDVKNYFNGVQRFRVGRTERKFREAVTMVSAWDKSLIPTFALGYDIDWGALFKLDQLDKMEAMTRIVTATSNAVNRYELTPDEAREVIQQQWAKLDIDVDLDDLTEADLDYLDRVNLNDVGAYKGGENAEGEMEGNPRVGQNGGGNEAGNTTDPSDPSS
jgi:hypothetical protein